MIQTIYMHSIQFEKTACNVHPRVRATVVFPSWTKSYCIAPKTFIYVRADVPLAGMPHELQFGPIRFNASATSQRTVWSTSLRYRSGTGKFRTDVRYKSLLTKWASLQEASFRQEVHCSLTTTVNLINLGAWVPTGCPQKAAQVKY